MKKRIIAMLLALVMGLSVVGCGDTNQQEPPVDNNSSSGDVSSQTPPPVTDPEPTPEPEVNKETVDYYMAKANEVIVTDTQVIFTDDSGRGEIAIDKGLENISVLYASLACLWYEAGGESIHLIGGKSQQELYTEQIGRDITKDEGTKVVSDSVSAKKWDVETILADQPDLIIVSMSLSGYSVMGEAALNVGIPVIAIQYDTVQDYLKWFKVFCNLSGHPELWDEVANATAEKVIEIVSKVPSDAKAPRVLTLRINNDVLEAYGNGSQIGSLVKELGGINVIETDPENGNTDSVAISMEDVFALDPDIILLPERGEAGAERAKFDQVYGENPVWLNLRAYKDGNVYNLERGLFHQKPNHRFNEAYLYLAQILYPNCNFE